MTEFAIIDTSVYVQHFRKGLYKKELQECGFLLRQSSVVLAEIYRGCRTEEERAQIDELAKNFPLITPTDKNWIESGVLLSKLGKKQGYSPDKLRDLHFDVLIALTARNIGARVITVNRRDFEEIQKLKDFKLICWE